MNKDTVKPWFETGDYPTQAQFWQLFDWIRWKDESLAIGDVSGLQMILNSIATIAAMKALFRKEFSLEASGSFTVDAGMAVTGIIVKSTNATEVSVGTTEGGAELIDTVALAAGVPVAISTIYYSETVQQLWFSGITSHAEIVLLTNQKL